MQHALRENKKESISRGDLNLLIKINRESSKLTEGNTESQPVCCSSSSSVRQPHMLQEQLISRLICKSRQAHTQAEESENADNSCL